VREEKYLKACGEEVEGTLRIARRNFEGNIKMHLKELEERACIGIFLFSRGTYDGLL
jgi:hypothetical protein